MKTFVVVCLAGFLLSGCQGMLNGALSGPSVCSPQELRLIQGNHVKMKKIMTDMPKDYILSPAGMGEPQGRNTYLLNNGQTVEALFYQVYSHSCRVHRVSLEKSVYEPLFFYGDRFVGMGQGFFLQQVHPFIYVPQNTMQRQQPMTRPPAF